MTNLAAAAVLVRDLTEQHLEGANGGAPAGRSRQAPPNGSAPAGRPRRAPQANGDRPALGLISRDAPGSAV
jgi:hypothetical protein